MSILSSGSQSALVFLHLHRSSPSNPNSRSRTSASPPSVRSASTASIEPPIRARLAVCHRAGERLIRTRVVSESVADSESVPVIVEPDTEDIEPGGFGGDSSGSEGSGGGGGGGGDREEGDDGEKGKEKKGMSMSQKLTLAYAALVGIGGVMGFIKSGSQKSLVAGGSSALLLYFVYTQLPVRTAFASSLGLGLSAALLVVMGSRFKKSGKIFPAGIVSVVSFVMAGGYLHGIMRGLHA
ncbi:UPF0136 membrane protein [Acorus gramineus]|uniref:UPF0136 membrane protein n=1 Tax=Acorus gramineus TaxID=55184 RepID=A0AAV9AFL6_ACOGR|nr:UPF0136 membrane protein [Acorus gramineus]